jgi:transposase
MFVRRIKRANGQVGIALVEGYRLNGKVKQRTIKYLGTESELTKDNPNAINELIEKYKNIDKKETFINLSLALSEKIPNINTIRNYGYFWLDKFYSELGLYQLCDSIKSNHSFEYDLNEALKLLVFMRTLNPCSKLATKENGSDYFIENFNIKLEEIYKALTILNEHKSEFISSIHKCLCEKYERKTDILYYDVTNYFFEIDEADDFRKKGCSKEHRPLPIVQMGLFIDNKGLPLDYALYEGNTPDCRTLTSSFEQVKEQFHTDKVIITADKGLNSGSNIGYILSKKNGYIVSQKIRGGSKLLVNEVLKDEDWLSFDDGTYKLKEFVRKINVTYPDGSKHEHEEKVVCIWSRKYQLKEKSERDNLLDKIAVLANNPTKFKQSCHLGMKKYIDETTVKKDTGEKANDVKIKTSLNLDKISKDEALDGYYLIVSSEIELSASEIISKYRGLWKIEQSFRVTKSDLRGRPVFVRTRDHINAHFLTCFISLTILRMIEIRLRNEYSSKRIIDALISASASEMSKGIYSLNCRDEIMSKLEECYEIKLENRYIKEEMMHKLHQEIIKSVYTTV